MFWIFDYTIAFSSIIFTKENLSVLPGSFPISILPRKSNSQQDQEPLRAADIVSFVTSYGLPQYLSIPFLIIGIWHSCQYPFLNGQLATGHFSQNLISIDRSQF
jgi:hypothetical protein